MHEYAHKNSTNILEIINYFENYTYHSDGNDGEGAHPEGVTYLTEVFKSSSEAKDKAEDRSYYDGTSIAIAKVCSGRVTKAFDKAYDSFKEKRKEYLTFKRNLTIAYGRSSAKVTCPHCSSQISLRYGRYFKSCPVCGSKQIISDSNWKTLATKKGLMEKASTTLEREACNSGVLFVGAIGWHS